MNIIILGFSRPDDPYSSTIWSLAQVWARRQHRVFFIEPPFTLRDWLGRRHLPTLQTRKSALLWGKNPYRSLPDDTLQHLTIVTPRLGLPINWLPEGRCYKALSWINDQWFAQTLKKTLRDFDLKEYIFINSFHPFLAQKTNKHFSPKVYVYQCVDNMRQAEYLSRHGARLEKQVAANADLVICTSRTLLAQQKNNNPNTFLLPNAADVALFEQARNTPLPLPQELEKQAQQPIIVYVGNADAMRMDFELLQKIATTNTDKTLLLVGPFKDHDLEKSGLKDLPNVVLTGSKPIQQIPAYLQHAACAIIPFLSNELTRGIYPLKINEYLAAGLPVVSTCFSPDIADFEQIIYLSKNHQDFLQNITRAIAENAPQKQIQRIEIARNNSWEKRAEQFEEIIKVFLSNKTKQGTKLSVV